MANSSLKTFLLAAVLLTIGAAIGWFVKPADTDHTDDTNGQNYQTNSNEIWTCSMHPQIRQNEAGICPICEMDLIPLDNNMNNDDPTVLMMTPGAAKLAQIETTIVGKGMPDNSMPKGIILDGTVELDERSINAQASHVSGRIDDLVVNFQGEYVKKGQKIASVYSTELLAASQELITAAQYDNKVPGIKEASIQKLRNWKLTDAQINSILETGQPVETVDIYADHSGYVLNKKMSQGDYVKQGQTIFTVGSTSRLWLIFNAFESDIDQIKIGQTITFTTPALGAQKFTARVSYIDPLLNTRTRTAVVRAEINNSNQKLKPGMLLKGWIDHQTTGNNKILSIPKSAVLWTGDKSVVYVRLPDSEVPSFQFREVTIGDSRGDEVIILEGLTAGEEIVIQGAFAIDAAAQLNNQMSMMNRDVTIKKDEPAGTVPTYVSETPQRFKSQLDAAILAYVDVKDQLVATDAVNTKLKAKSFLNVLESIDTTGLENEALDYWMNQYAAMKNHSDNIINTEDVESQRVQFSYLSQSVINSLRAFGTDHHTYYVQYCPMALDNQGADWLSTAEEIRNPYFGDKMMKCGNVKLVLN